MRKSCGAALAFFIPDIKSVSLDPVFTDTESNQHIALGPRLWDVFLKKLEAKSKIAFRMAKVQYLLGGRIQDVIKLLPSSLDSSDYSVCLIK